MSHEFNSGEGTKVRLFAANVNKRAFQQFNYKFKKISSKQCKGKKKVFLNTGFKVYYDSKVLHYFLIEKVFLEQ